MAELIETRFSHLGHRIAISDMVFAVKMADNSRNNKLPSLVDMITGEGKYLNSSK